MKRSTAAALVCSVWAFGATMALGELYNTASTAPQEIPICQEEDGNPDGKPCFWADPDTGDMYFSDSSNYHN